MRLIKEMRAKGIPSQNQLAAKSGITPADVSKIVNRRMVPYPGQLRKLAAAIGYPEDDAHRLLEEVSGDDH